MQRMTRRAWRRDGLFQAVAAWWDTDLVPLPHDDTAAGNPLLRRGPLELFQVVTPNHPAPADMSGAG